jgi:hypothetical protein
MLSAIKRAFEKPPGPVFRATSPTILFLGENTFAIGIEKDTDKLFLYKESKKSGDTVSGKNCYDYVTVRHINHSNSGDVVIISTETIIIRYTLLKNNERYIEAKGRSYFVTIDPSIPFVPQGHAEFDKLAVLFAASA